MKDAEDKAIVRQVMIAVAAAIFCLFCGGICGIFVVRNDPAAGIGVQRGELSPPTPRG